MKNLVYACCIGAVLASCNQPANNNAATERNKAAMQKFVDEVGNKQNIAAIDSILAPDFVDHSPAPGFGTDREATKKVFTEYYKGFPDGKMKVNFMVADSNTVVMHYTSTGTNSGSMMGMPATNKATNYDGVDIVKFNKDGKATDHWGYMEESKMMTQLGMMPDMSAPKTDSTAKANGKTEATTKADATTTTTTTVKTKEVTKVSKK